MEKKLEIIIEDDDLVDLVANFHIIDAEKYNSKFSSNMKVNEKNEFIILNLKQHHKQNNYGENILMITESQMEKLILKYQKFILEYKLEK